jgi:ABC-type multidrug transport system ATPase subunit
MTIIMITHFMEETLDFDQDIVLDKGSIALSGTPQDVLTQIDRLHELNLEPPFACKLSDALQQRGVPVHLHSTDAGLITDLKKLYTDSAQDALATSANPSMSKEELQ